MTAKIKGTEAAWDSRKLGNDPAHTRAAPRETAAQIDDALGLQMISIRLDKSLIDAFKTLGEFHGIGYQPLMRNALHKFAECEMKMIVAGVVESQRKPAVKKAAEKKAA
jgi:uncharacterized protein (DUF4415 family)